MSLAVDIYGPTLDARVFPFDGGSELNIHEDIRSIETSKSLSNPTGTFTITLTSRRTADGHTWAQRIRPMDYVEIYMGRGVPKGVQSSIVMRGLVDATYETSSVANNRVERTVRIVGRDFGKVVLKRALVFFTEIDPLMSSVNSTYGVGLKLGPGGIEGAAGLFTPMEFLSRIRDFLLNDATVGAGFRNGRIPQMGSFTDIPDWHKVALTNMTPSTGSIWQFLEQWEGKPWNELFIRDDDDRPRIYWRLAPLKSRSGIIIPHGDAMPSSDYQTIDVPLRRVISPDVGTSDNEATCYFFTTPLYAEQFGGPAVFVLPLGADEHPFNVPEGTAPPVGPAPHGQVLGANPIVRTDIFQRYGFNAMKVSYPMLPLPLSGPVDPKHELPYEIAAPLVGLTSWLHNAFSPNPAFESGTILIAGQPDIRVGRYMRIVEQDREFYVEGVDHHFSIWPQVMYTTSVSVTRGLWHNHNPYPELNWL